MYARFMTNTDDYQKKTIETYNRNADKWAKAHGKVIEWEDQLLKFKEKYLQEGSLVDIGCGSGRDIGFMASLGFDCAGVDASKGLLKYAKKENPRVDFKKIDIFELRKLDREFDGFLCIATLLHFQKTKMDDALNSIRSILKPSSVGIIILKEGKGEEFEVRDIDDRHEERFFAYWLIQEFKDVLDRNNFSTLETFKSQVGRSTWIGFFVENNGN